MKLGTLKLLCFFVALILTTPLGATHNRAGEISFEQVGPLTLRVTVTTYTKTSSIAADRDSIEIFWGDGTSQFAVRANGWGDPQPNDVKINYYIATHNYPARATYTISMYDPNRVGGILNVNYPDSESVPFYLETTFTFLNTQFQGENNSAVLLQAPIDFGCVGEVFVHNPNAYDQDGDSIRYRLVIPLQSKNTIVPDYLFPDQIIPGPDNRISLDQQTGDLVWDAPKIAGEYNIAIRIEEYRKGILINSMIRDMQIFILDACENKPPTISLNETFCVLAGEEIQTEVIVNDPDPGQKVRLEASGAPFISTRYLAELEGGFVFADPSFNALFKWKTACEDISDQYYQIVFKAMDDGISDTSGLASLKTIRIKVMAPKITDLRAEAIEDHHLLSWEYPYGCAFAANDYFLGFSIWRSQTSIALNIDSCATGLNNKGYEKIVFSTKENDGTRYFYEDFEIEPGNNYCYRIVPEFARRTFDGFPYNQVAGKPSDEICISLPLTLPYLTKTSVRSTNPFSGEMDVSWNLPDPAIFDTVAIPGPYLLTLNRGENGTAPMPIPGATYSFPYYNQLSDYSFVDSGLDTENSTYRYLLDLYSSSPPAFAGSSLPASSLFLKTLPSDGQITLTFQADVPWSNYQYHIYRKDPGDFDFKLVGNTLSNVWTDSGLENETNYCYYVESEGRYLNQPEDTLLNLSQVVCAIAKDTRAPCTPRLWVENGCDTAGIYIRDDELINTIHWEFDESTCPAARDLAGFNIYYSPSAEEVPGIIAELYDPTATEFQHKGELGLKGCYTITAIDSSLNESAPAPLVCVENCPVIEFPNVFTPNDDGVHDLFRPRYIRHVFKVEMKIFNQWGQLIFRTDNPQILWDGLNLSGEPVAEGVYHYICQVEATLAPDQPEQQILSGFIELIRGK